MDLLGTFQPISDQVTKTELRIILRQLQQVLDKRVTGDVVEFGCFVGTTSLFLQRHLIAAGSAKKLHVYDSFAGLPAKTAFDASPAGEQFQAGELKAAKQAFIKHFKQAGLPLPVIHKGWFSELTGHDVPSPIAFAFLDGDFYQSIHGSLALVWPQLSPGAIVVVDDYQSEALPGARRAVDEWLGSHPAQLRVQASLAIIKI